MRVVIARLDTPVITQTAILARVKIRRQKTESRSQQFAIVYLYIVLNSAYRHQLEDRRVNAYSAAS